MQRTRTIGTVTKSDYKTNARSGGDCINASSLTNMNLTAKLQLSATVEILSKMIKSQYNWFYAHPDNLTDEEKSTLVKACMLHEHYTGKKTFVAIKAAVSEKLDEPVSLFI